MKKSRLYTFLVPLTAALLAGLVGVRSSHAQGSTGPDGDITAVRTGPNSGLIGGTEKGVANPSLKGCAAGSGMVSTGSAGSAAWDCGTVGVADGDKGDITVASGVWTLDDFTVTFAKMANLAQATVVGRAAGAGTGSPQALNQAQLTALVNPATSSTSGAVNAPGTSTGRFYRDDFQWVVPTDTNTTYTATSPLTLIGTAFGLSNGNRGDITTSTGTQAGDTWTINTAAVTLAKLANLANATFICRVTAGAGVPEACTAAQATSLLNVATTTTKGLVPAPVTATGKVLGDGLAWITLPTGLTNGAGNNVVPKSNGTNLVASSITDNGTTVNTTLPLTESSNRVFSVPGSGLARNGTNANTIDLALTPQACSAGAHISGVATNGVFTCSSDSTTNSGLTTGVYPKASSASNLVDGRISDTTGETLVAGATANTGVYFQDNAVNFAYGTAGVATGWLNIRGTAGGTGAFRNLIVGDGKTAAVITVTGSSKQVDVAGGLTAGNNLFVVTGSQVAVANGPYFTADQTINVGNGNNSLQRLYLNYYGYAQGTTQFRDLEIDDGKGAKIADCVGSTKTCTFSGALLAGDTQVNTTATNSSRFSTNTTVVAGGAAGTLNIGTVATGGINIGSATNATSIVGNTSVGNSSSNTLTLTATTTAKAPVTFDNNAPIVTAGSVIRDTGTAPTSFTCGTSPSAVGGRYSFDVTVGTGTVASCVINFSAAFNSAKPSCQVIGDKRAGFYITARSASSITITTATGANLAGDVLTVTCVDH